MPKVILGLLISLSIVLCFAYFGDRSGTRRKKLIILCSSYVLFLFVFGQLYFILYRQKPENFIFSAEILSRRQADSVFAIKKEIGDAEELKNAISKLLDQLNNGHVIIDVSSADSSLTSISTPDYVYEFMFDSSWSGDIKGRRFRAGQLTAKGKDGHKIGTERIDLKGPDPEKRMQLPKDDWDAIISSYFPPTSIDKYIEILTPLQDRLNHNIEELRGNSEENNNPNREWKYLDFFYFSTITQTTVGYGDILPNSSVVRIAVIAQIVIGLLILGVGIGCVISSPD